MRVSYFTLAVPTVAGESGDSTLVEDLENITIQVLGIFEGEVGIELSLDGSNWYQQVSYTTNKIEVLPLGVYKRIRVKLVAITSGVPQVLIAGRNSRTH